MTLTQHNNNLPLTTTTGTTSTLRALHASALILHRLTRLNLQPLRDTLFDLAALEVALASYEYMFMEFLGDGDEKAWAGFVEVRREVLLVLEEVEALVREKDRMWSSLWSLWGRRRWAGGDVDGWCRVLVERAAESRSGVAVRKAFGRWFRF